MVNTTPITVGDIQFSDIDNIQFEQFTNIINDREFGKYPGFGSYDEFGNITVDFIFISQIMLISCSYLQFI